MIKYKHNIFNFIGSVICIALFCLFISFFSNKSSQQDNNIVQHELITDFCSNYTNAVLISKIKLPVLQMSWISVVDKLNLKCSEENYKIIADNKKLRQIFISLQKTQLIVKPNVRCKFYYHLFSLGTDDFRILG